MYYLQTRYYDPFVGRFILSDDAEYVLAVLKPNGHGIFTYCLNNPIKFVDPTGHIAFVDDIAIWAFIGLCAILMCLVAYMSTPQFRSSWASFCTAVGNGLTWIGTGIVNGGRAAWNWTRKQVKAATSAITTFIALTKAVSKVQTRVKNARRNSYRFFEIWFDRIGTPIIGRTLNQNQAVTRARRGLNSITYYSSDARYVANLAGGNRAMWHQKHGGLGYFNHYYIYNHSNSAHIYYIIAG